LQVRQGETSQLPTALLLHCHDGTPLRGRGHDRWRTPEVDTSRSHGRYSIEYKGRTIMDDRALLCQYGKVKRLFRIADVSNGDFEEVRASSIALSNIHRA
jgi:hypothetical protein